MAKLTPEQRDERLRFDFQIVSRMRSPILSVEAYESYDDLMDLRNPILSEARAHLASHYRVDYKIRTLLGKDLYSSSTTVHLDLLAGGDYPMTEPACWVISDDIPWTPHFSSEGFICAGSVWELSYGKMLLGHLLVHIAKLINFDEIPLTNDYGGYNPDAFYYWKEKFNLKPITPNLPYPVLPAVSPDEQPAHEVLFKAVSQRQTAPVEFRARQVTRPSPVEFRPK